MVYERRTFSSNSALFATGVAASLGGQIRYSFAMRINFAILVAVAVIAALLILRPRQIDDFESLTLEGGIAAHLPDVTTNNAIAAAEVGGDPYLFSFFGLGAGREPGDIHSQAYAVNLAEQWAKTLPGVPGAGRLAGAAATVGGTIYIFGGYTVGANGTEVSTPDVFAYHPESETYEPRAPIPLPVDDSVALPYQDRYVYLVSGWHDTGNVAAVQVYDTETDSWFAATSFPGTPVFGHAGGIVGNAMVIADGVKVAGRGLEGRRIFEMSDEAYVGVIDPEDPARIAWDDLNPHPGRPLYRMAATGDEASGMVIFAGGSDNPYNYDGIGYNGVPSRPSATVFAFDLARNDWRLLGQKLYPSMDHRGLLKVEEKFYILGGMVQDQEVSDAVSWFQIPGSGE